VITIRAAEGIEIVEANTIFSEYPMRDLCHRVKRQRRPPQWKMNEAERKGKIVNDVVFNSRAFKRSTGHAPQDYARGIRPIGS
jgi:hypothetical protein